MDADAATFQPTLKELTGADAGAESCPAILRLTVDADVPGILDLIRTVYAEYGQHLNTEEEPHVLTPGPYFRGHGGRFWVVDERGAIRATCGVKVEDGISELKTLYVHGSLRRRGWGRRLVEVAMEHALGAGASDMVLWSDTRFLDAHRLYRRLGFEHDGLRELRDSNLTWEYGFRMALEPARTLIASEAR